MMNYNVENENMFINIKIKIMYYIFYYFMKKKL